MSYRISLSLLAWLVAASPAVAQDAPEAPDGAGAQPENLQAIGNKQINPVSDMWSLVFQHDTALFKGNPSGSHRANSDFKFQPVLPLDLTDDLRFIARPLLPLVVDRSIPDQFGEFDRHASFGDIGVATLLAPAKKEAEGLSWGLGATWLFPTATVDDLSGEKYGVGPAAVAFWIKEPWIIGAFPQHIWSYAGDDDRDDISLTNTQLFLLRTVPGTQWKVGMTPNILIDWKADGGNKYSVPVGLGATKVYKVGKVPVRLLFEAQYYVARPNDYGPRWNFRVLIAPVIPKPAALRKPLFGR